MPLVFTFLQKIESQAESETIHYVFQSGMTVVSSREASRYLDYHGKKLFQYDTASGQCRVFPLETAAQSGDSHQHPVPAGVARQLGELTLDKKEVFQTIGGYTCQQHSVGWGDILLKSRRMIRPEVEQYGMQFAPLRETVWISGSFPEISRLAELADANEPLYQANPLLRRLDPLGIFRRAGGFPVARTAENLQYSLIKIERLNSLVSLPESCEKSAY